MKRMKLLGIILIAFGFSQCASQKLVKNPPFTINSASQTNWIGGKPGSNKLTIKIHYQSESDIVFDSIYFGKRVAKLEKSESSGIKTATGSFYSSLKQNDIILHSDTKKEVGNQPPKVNKLPFELKKSEAIISYKKGKKTRYFKIQKIKEEKPIIMQ